MLAIEQDQPLCSLEVMCLATTKSVVSCIHTEGVSFVDLARRITLNLVHGQFPRHALSSRV